MEKLQAIFILIKFICVCQAYKVLLVFPFSSKSHGYLGDGYVRHLLAAGHQVTYITAFPNNTRHTRLREIDVSSKSVPNIFNLQNIMIHKKTWRDHNEVFFLFNTAAQSILRNENVQNLINNPEEQFVVVIAEWLFSELYCGFAAVFNCPYIWSLSSEPHSLILSLIDEPINPAYTPSALSYNVAPFNFRQRIEELWDLITNIFYKKFYFSQYENQQYELWFGRALSNRRRLLPPYEIQKYNASLVLGNSHSSFGEATSLPQNYKGIGGYHIRADNNESLAQDLKNIMDNAKYGVIFFSMGSVLKSSDFPKELLKNLLKMFGSLKQEIIWKFEGSLAEKPKNIHTISWAPQQNILRHPNCIMLVTHGGLLSTIEAIHFGVPLIGIPAFADQFTNVGRAVNKGYAIKVDLSYDLAEDLYRAIQKMLDKPKYSERAKELSAIYHDRPIPPGKELVYWIEHVVRTSGAKHLRSLALMLPWYQKMYIDLISSVLITIITAKIFVMTLRTHFSRTRAKFKDHDKKE